MERGTALRLASGWELGRFGCVGSLGPDASTFTPCTDVTEGSGASPFTDGTGGSVATGGSVGAGGLVTAGWPGVLVRW